MNFLVDRYMNHSVIRNCSWNTERQYGFVKAHFSNALFPERGSFFRTVEIVEDFGLGHSKSMFPNKEYACFSLLAAVEVELHTI